MTSNAHPGTRRRCARVLFLLAAVLAVAAAELPAQTDTIRALRVSDCCFTFTVQNGNAGQVPISLIILKIVTPGASFVVTGTPPAGWLLSFPASVTANFESSVQPIPPFGTKDGFTLCVNTPLDYVDVNWQTRNGGLLLGVGSFRLACRDRDTVDANAPDLSCCTEWSVRNRNYQRQPVDAFSLVLRTPGFTWGPGTKAPASWQFALPSPDSLHFTGAAAPIALDSALRGFVSCLVPAPKPRDRIIVAWATYRGGSVLSRDTTGIICEAANVCDTVTAVPSGAGNCCFSFTALNANPSKTAVDGLRLTVTTMGTLITSAPGGPWPVTSFSAAEVVFSTTGAGIAAGQSLGGFTICLQNFSGFPFQVRWQTLHAGATVCEGMVTVLCGPAQRCDSVVVGAVDATPVGCCHTLSVYNRHEPAGAISRLRLRPAPGLSFFGTPAGPWSVAFASDTLVEFSASTPLAAGDSARGFRVCVFTGATAPGGVAMLWETRSAQGALCSGTLGPSCMPALARRDSLYTASVQGCVHEFGVKNTHLGPTPVDGFSLTMLTPGAGIAAPQAPSGWTVASQTAVSASFAAGGAPLAPGATQAGYRVTLVPGPFSDSMRVARATSFRGVPITTDTAVLICRAAPTACDSVLVQETGGDCSFLLGVMNLHQPASRVDEFHLTVQTPGASAAGGSAPAGWSLAQPGGSSIVWRDSGSGIAPGATLSGFQARLQKAAGNDNILLEWCTYRGGQKICCGTRLVRCVSAQQRCDSLIIRPTQYDCTFELGFANLHSPASGLDGLTVRVHTPGAAITGVTTIQGWGASSSAPQTEVVFRDSSGGIASGSAISGFRVSFSPPPGSGSIRIAWCTSYAGRIVCCDSANVECQPPSTRCDSITHGAVAGMPCCFDFTVHNDHQPTGTIDGFRLAVLEPLMAFFPSRTGSPFSWVPQSAERDIAWNASAQGIMPKAQLGGFRVCLGRQPGAADAFHLVWTTLSAGAALCADTLALSCTATLDAGAASVPRRFALHAAYPNPASSTAVFRVDIPVESDVAADLYDARGRLVRSVAAGRMAASSRELSIDASRLDNGMYFLVLRAGRFTGWSAMTVLH